MLCTEAPPSDEIACRMPFIELVASLSGFVPVELFVLVEPPNAVVSV